MKSTGLKTFLQKYMSRPTFRLGLGSIAIMLVVTGVILIAYAQEVADDGAPLNAFQEEPLVPVSGRSIAKGFEYVSADDMFHSTTSMVHVPVPDMLRNFDTTATRQTLLITYSAFTFTVADELLYVVARVDGADANPGEVQFDGDPDEDGDGKWARSHSFQWVFPDLAPGNHTVEIYWRSFSGGTVFTHKRTMSVFRDR